MPYTKSHAPGLKRRKRADGETRLWLPRPADIKRGYPIKSLTIPARLNDEEAAALCRKYQAELEAWREGVESGPVKHSLAWLIQRYQTHQESPFHKLGYKTKQNYAVDCKIIGDSIGRIRIDLDGVHQIDRDKISEWHRKWSKPGKDGKPTAISRGHHVATMLRTLVKYAVGCRVPGAVEWQQVLSSMTFEMPPQRTIAPRRDQVMALVDAAIAHGYRSIAIATLAQFELTERRISIIGQWEGDHWRPGWVWTGIDRNWNITYEQNKVAKIVRVFDLTSVKRLLELIQRTPEDSRIGPIIICEATGKAWTTRHYNTTFREIARIAGVPDNIRSMDMRAGGATETDGLGATDREMQDSGGWVNAKTVNRYRRNKQRNAQNVVILRQKALES